MINFSRAYIGSTLVSGGTSTFWSRPSDWLSLPVLQSTDNKFVGLLAITNDTSNWVALNCTTSGGTYTVDWGDGSQPQTYTSGQNAQYQYTYANISNSTITSTGYKQVVVTVTPTSVGAGATLTTFSLQVLPSTYSTTSGAVSIPWLDISIAGNALTSVLIATNAVGATTTNISLNELQQITIQSLSSSIARLDLFCYNLYSLRSFICNAGLGACTNFSNMFKQCFALTNVSLFNTSAGTNFSGMFYSCSSLSTIPLFNTGNGLDFSYMFSNCSALISIPLLNTSKATTFFNIFNGCTALNSIPLLDTSKVTTFQNAFSSCSSLVTIPALNTSSATTMQSMFFSCYALVNIPLLDTSKVNNVSTMFQNCFALTYVPPLNMTGVNVSAVSMFTGCAALTSAALSGIRYSISYAPAPKLATNELNAIFSGLGLGVASPTISVTNCYGAATCNRAIASGKGWLTN